MLRLVNKGTLGESKGDWREVKKEQPFSKWNEEMVVVTGAKACPSLRSA